MIDNSFHKSLRILHIVCTKIKQIEVLFILQM